MKQKFTRLMLAAVMVFASMSAWALTGTGTTDDPYIIESGVALPCPSAQSTIFYQYTPSQDGMLVLDNSQVASDYPYIYYGSDFYSCYNSFNDKQPVMNGQKICISCNCYNDISSKTISFTFREAEKGETYTNPFEIAAGAFTWKAISSSTWYKAVVPAKSELKISAAPSGYGYAGLSAIASNTYIYPTYGAGNYVWDYINTSSEAVDFYINVSYNYEDINATVTIEAADIADYSHVTGNGTSYSPYNVILDKPYPAGSSYSQVYYQYVAETSGWLNINMEKFSTGAATYANTNLSNLSSSYYQYQVNGGFAIEAGNTYYIMLYFYSDESARSVSFNVGEMPAGVSVDNPKTLVEGDNTWSTQNEWWMITVPAGKELTIAPNSYVGYNAYAGKENAKNLTPTLETTYNYSTYAPDLIYTNTTGADVDIYVTISYLSYTITANVSLKNAGDAPTDNLTQFGALTWNVTDGKVPAGTTGVTVTFPSHVGGEDTDAVTLENVYIFNADEAGAPLNLSGTTTFTGTLGDGVTINFGFETGKNYRISIGNVICGSYSAPGPNEPVVTNSEITFSVEAAAAAVFNSALNSNHAAGTTVKELSTEFDLYAAAAVENINESKFYLQKDGSLLANPVYVGSFDNQLFAYFEGSGFKEEGTYTFVVEAGAATVGGQACEAQNFVWTISSTGGNTPTADVVNITGVTNGTAVAGSTVETMSIDFEITCDAAGLTRLNADAGESEAFKLTMPWGGSDFDITSYINNSSWVFSGNTIRFSLRYADVYSWLDTEGEWKITMPEGCFMGATEDTYNTEANFSWTVRKSVVYNAPVLTGATNGGKDAGSKVSNLSSDFYISLTEESAYAGYGIYYWYDEATDFNANIEVTMSEDKKTAKVTVNNVDLTREGTHSLNITAGAFYNANDYTKSLAAGQRYDWILGEYKIMDVRNGSAVGYKADTEDQIDRPFFENRFTITLSAPSTAVNPFTATLAKNGAAYLSNAKVTAESTTEFTLEFVDWPHSTTEMPTTDGEGNITGTIEVTTYQSLEPGSYTLTLASAAFLSNDTEPSKEWNGTWNVADKVYPWSLATEGTVNGSSTKMDGNHAKLASNFTIAFQSGLSNVARGEGAITLTFTPEVGSESETIYTEPTSVTLTNGSAYITFGTEDLKRNGMYTVNVAENAFTGTYTPSGASASVEAGNASGSFGWNVQNNYSFTMPDCGWTTICVDYVCQWPTGCTVYYAAEAKNNKVLALQAKYHAGESDEHKAYIAAFTGLLVQGTPGTKYTVYRPIDESYLTSFDNNLFEGTVEPKACEALDSYELDTVTSNTTTPYATIFYETVHPANSAWLPASVGNEEIVHFVFSAEDLENTPTGISTTNNKKTINGCFNVLGQPVGEDYKGIVIIDGKKYIK